MGYQTRGVFRRSGIPWTLDADVDVNSSVFDSNFLQFEYRHFLEQIGFVPGMAAHVKSNLGPVALILEWNGALTNAEFVDDAGDSDQHSAGAWQVSLGYQFDWNPQVEIIGVQGTYLAMSYSESYDLAGVTDFVGDPLAPTTPRWLRARTAVQRRRRRMGARRPARGRRILARRRLRRRRGRHRQLGQRLLLADDLRMVAPSRAVGQSDAVGMRAKVRHADSHGC